MSHSVVQHIPFIAFIAHCWYPFEHGKYHPSFLEQYFQIEMRPQESNAVSIMQSNEWMI